MAIKLTYDTANKLFILNSGVTSLDAKVDLYSDAKEDWKTDATLTKFRFPIIAIGGNSIGGGQSVSPYFILKFGWKIRPQEANHTLVVVGNVITDDESQPIVATTGAFNVVVRSQITSNSLTVSGGSGITEQDKLDIADRVLDELLSGHSIEGSLAAELKKKLSTAMFLALK